MLIHIHLGAGPWARLTNAIRTWHLRRCIRAAQWEVTWMQEDLLLLPQQIRLHQARIDVWQLWLDEARAR